MPENSSDEVFSKVGTFSNFDKLTEYEKEAGKKTLKNLIKILLK